MQFDFGANWSEFSKNALNRERVEQAKNEFITLLSYTEQSLKGKSFLDIGFGQGLSLLAASSLGAEAIGCDINPKCGEVITCNRHYYADVTAGIPLTIGSILDDGVVQSLREKSPQGQGFDIVHSWGVLHHTGNMNLAIRNAVSLVKPGGHFILALYNRHWSSLPWLWIKWLYVKSPPIVKNLLVYALFPVIFLAKFIVTGKNPLKQQRGMDFYYNVIDWVGGYPYEYASIQEVEELLKFLGFMCKKSLPAEVPTGCNEFVFVSPISAPINHPSKG